MTTRGSGLPINLSLDDLGPVPELDACTVKRAQMNAAEILGPGCGDMLAALGIDYNTGVRGWPR